MLVYSVSRTLDNRFVQPRPTATSESVVSKYKKEMEVSEEVKVGSHVKDAGIYSDSEQLHPRDTQIVTPGCIFKKK